MTPPKPWRHVNTIRPLGLPLRVYMRPGSPVAVLVGGGQVSMSVERLDVIPTANLEEAKAAFGVTDEMEIPSTRPTVRIYDTAKGGV